MYKLPHSSARYLLSFIFLLMISCSKQNTLSTVPRQETGSEYVIQVPPSILFWGRGAVVPSAPPYQSSGRVGAFSFAINGKGYVGAGLPAFNGNGNDVWQYDPATLTWSQVSNFPGAARYYSASFVINNDAYVCTGNTDGDFYNDVKENWQYDQTTNTWIQKTNFPGKARAAAVAGAINGMGYVGTGAGNNKVSTSDWWQYNPANDSWTQKASIPGSKKAGAAAFTSTEGGGRIYVCAGADNVDLDGGINVFRDLWEYTPSSNSWRQRANFPASARAFAVGISAMNTGIVGTGYLNPGTIGFNDWWQYLPSSNTWHQLPSMQGTRDWAMGFAIGNTVYAGTGYNGGGLNDFWGLTFPSTP